MYSVLVLVLLLVGTGLSKPLDDDMLLFWRRTPSESCSPFSTYMLGCNKCVCSAEGVPYCTKMLCASKTQLEDKVQQKEYSDEID